MTRFEIRPAEPDDIDIVLENVSAQTRGDMDVMGWDADIVKRKFRPRTTEADSVTLLEDGAPIAVFGWDKPNGGGVVWFSWLVAATPFYDGRTGPIRVSRRYFERMASENPGVSFNTIVLQQSDRLDRWMRLLGFVRVAADLPRYRLAV